MSQTPDRDLPTRPVSRRTLLGSGALVLGGVVAGCSAPDEPVPAAGDTDAPQRQPLPPDEESSNYQFLGPEEVRALEAVVARIMPGDDSDPGALQAGVPRYIDSKLSTTAEGFAEPTFLQPPLAVGVPPDGSVQVGPDEVGVAEDQLYRYGYQSGNTPQQVYRLGLAAMDRYAQTRFGRLYADLSPERQDELLQVLEAEQSRGEELHTGFEPLEGSSSSDGPSESELDRAVDIFGEVGPGEFFGTIRSDTIAGMFADPAYGGNAEMSGWLLLGYPGAQRSYSPEEMLRGTDKQPQAMHGLPSMNPDRADPHGREALEQDHDGHVRRRP